VKEKNMIDRWIESMTFKQSLIAFFGTIAGMGALVGIMALLIGYNGIVALLAGLGAFGIIAGYFGVRLAIGVRLKLRTGNK
jgi:hypothetical protein